MEVFEDVWPNRLLGPPLVAGVPKEIVGTDFEGSDMVIIVEARDERVYAGMLQEVSFLSSKRHHCLTDMQALRVTPLPLADGKVPNYEGRD